MRILDFDSVWSLRTPLLLSAALCGLGTIAATVIAAPAPTEVHAQATCPAASPRARAIVERFLTSEGKAAMRAELGMASVTAAHLSLLADSADAMLCAQLKAIAPTPAAQGRFTISDTYFRANGFYFVVRIKAATDGSTLLAWSPLLIFKRQLKDWQFIEAIAM